ncbi:MAG: GNAT family N-acyltransferase [Bacteroidota bacterium]|nr:GNAT family N-acyltransferase [Bacteroidota bacterium]
MELIQTNDVIKVAKLDKFGGKNTAKILMSVFQFDKINQIYSNHSYKPGPEFIEAVLAEAEIKFNIDETSLARIPEKGSFILIANHPFGGIEGLILLNKILAIRPDFKIMGNFLFHHIKPIKDYVFAVNPFESHKETQSSFQGLKSAFQHISSGRPLAIFPAGEVSTFHNQANFISDKTWNSSILKFIKNAEVPVIPVYFEGGNSWLFHAMGKINPMLRTARIPSEMLNKQNKVIKVSIGNSVSVKEQRKFPEIEEYGRYLRARTYALETKQDIGVFFNMKKRPAKAEDIIAPISGYLLMVDIAKIAGHYELFRHQHYTIFCAPSPLIPNITYEIGRLREITFREVGEGTNRSTDIDEYDLYYHQLFIWDEENQAIVGGYRIGKGADIISQFGMNGFYIQTLFKIDKKLQSIFSQSIELGRSFVVKEYQRKPMSLFLLWKGILYFLLKNPDYQYLVGPVSISNKYSVFSQQIMINFVKKNYFNDNLACYVKPRNPFVPVRYSEETETLLEKAYNLNKLDEVISDLESDNSRMPVMLKKYLSLGGKIISFNVDPDFNNSLDGLLILDVKDIDPNIIHSLSKKLRHSMA